MLQTFSHYIDGQFEVGSAHFDSIDPAHGLPWASMPAATPEDVDRAVRAAHRALQEPVWGKLHASARGKLLARLADLVARDAGMLAEVTGTVGDHPLCYRAAMPSKVHPLVLIILDGYAYTEVSAISKASFAKHLAAWKAETYPTLKRSSVRYFLATPTDATETKPSRL